MNLAELERRNAETLRKIREAPGTAQFPQDAYFGFYTADIFECPPFLMFTANDCPRALDILYSRRFEPMSMLIWCRLAPSASFICDIGAHVGVYSLAAAALCPQKPIEAFEPNPYAFTRLRLHKLVNAFRNINENRFGLAHADGTATFSWHKRDTMIIASGGGIGKRPEGTGEQVLAEFRRLDGLPQAASFHGRGLMKIDVEGAEVLAFQGMQRVLQERPDLLLESFSAESCEQITEMLLPLGYRFYRVREQAMTVEPLPRLEPSIIASGDLNMLLTTRPAAEIERLLGAAARPEAAQGGGSLASAFADPDTFAQWRSALASRFGKYRDALEAAPDAERAQATSKLLFAAICAGEAETAQVSMRSLFPDSRTALPLAVAPVEPLADACRRAGTNAHVALPPRGVDLPADASAPAMAYQADAAVYACLPDASLCPGWDHVITREGNVVSDLGYLPIDVGHAHRPQAYLRREGIVAYHAPDGHVDHPGDAIFLSLPAEGHFGHWTIDFLPRLRARHYAGAHVRFAVPDSIAPKHLDSLALFDVQPEDLILCDGSRRHRFERLHVYNPGRSIPAHPEHVAFLRRGFGRFARAPKPKKRLHLTRGRVGTRVVVNADDFQSVLSEFEFVSVDVAELSLQAQMALLADAEIVLGSFGSNLLAIYMAPGGARLIVLADDDAPETALAPICRMIGVGYTLHPCASAGRSQNPRHLKDRDLLVDVEALRRELGHAH